MADHATPTISTGYADYTTAFRGRLTDLALMLDPATSSPTNLPTNSVRWTSAANKWQKWNGTTWVDLSAAYDINIAGVAATATALATIRTINGVNFNGTANITLPTVNTSGDQNIAGVKTFSSPIAGSINGNAATVTNGVYTTGAQNIDGVKTFLSTIVGNINGTAGGVAPGGSLGTDTTATTTAVKEASTRVATTAAVDRLRDLLPSSTTGTLVIGDRGCLVPITSNITVPNAVFSANAVITVYNNSGANQLLVQGSGLTMYLVGTGSTGNRTIAPRGMATITYVAGNVAIISGGGVS